ncbi:MAG: hypothetical protein H7328_03940 [Bdellovibrio sp.]|nr:hypothetical protein [Bdellovibrio sp.]
MKFNIGLKILSLVLVSQTLWAQSSQELVKRDVLKIVKTFSRETRLYSYFGMPVKTKSDGSKTIDSWFEKDQNRQQWLVNFVESRAGAFWNLNEHGTFKVNAGHGMYFALDPNSSREYGDTMITLDVPQGSNYITTVSTITLKPDTLSALVKEGVITAAQLKVTPNTLGLETGLTAEALKNMVLPENQNFRILVQNVFQALQIKFIEYGYKAHQNGFCQGGRQTAIIFVGSKPADQSSSDVRAMIEPQFTKLGLAADYLVGFFPEPTNTFVALTMKYRTVVSEIRSTAMDAPKLVNRPKANAIISRYMTPQETAYLRSLSFECKTPQ